MTNFVNDLKKRRSIYALGKDVPLSEEEISDLVTEVVRESPTAFNSQTQRLILLFDHAHDKLWTLIEDALKPLTPPEAFPNTQKKLASFKAAKGTILFFEDMATVQELQDQFPLYAENFPLWSEQSTGIAAVNVWTALAQNNIGGNLQHYNPVIDEAVSAEWQTPENWKLRSQLVFGSIENPAGEKAYLPNEERIKIFR